MRIIRVSPLVKYGLWRFLFWQFELEEERIEAGIDFFSLKVGHDIGYSLKFFSTFTLYIYIGTNFNEKLRKKSL